MNTEELERRIAVLESINDQLYTELATVDELLREVGFTNGLETVKNVAHEILEESEINENFNKS